jgi:hypothetical protein
MKYNSIYNEYEIDFNIKKIIQDKVLNANIK